MRKVFIALTALITITSHAQESMKLSLQECMDYALKHNINIKNAQIDVMIQDAQNKETLSASYPHINGKLELDDFYVTQKSFIDGAFFGKKGEIEAFPFSLNYAGSSNFTGSQLIFDGAVFVAWKARNTVMQLARQNGDITEEGVRYNIYKAYNALVIANRQYDILKNSLTYARSMEHDLEVTKENGFAERIDVERTSVQVNNLATDSIRIGNTLTVAENMLKYEMGMDIRTRIALTDTAVEKNRQDALDLLNAEKDYDRVPEYKAVNTTLTLNQYNLMRYKYAALPSLNAFWSYGTTYGSNTFADLLSTNNYYAYSTIGVQMNIPIMNGFLRVNQVREARLNIEKSRNSLENMKQTIDYQTAVSKTTLKNAILQVRSQRRNMELANDVLDLAQKKYKAGVGSNVEVTQAQTDLLGAQNNYFNALLDIINAEADLKKALGLLK